jgi:competence protein ComEA
MAFVELHPGAHRRAGRGTKKVASPLPHGGGRLATPAARGVAQRSAEAFAKSVWAPIALKALGVLAGMLALAAVGASSIARGSGVRATAPSAHHAAPRLAAAGVTPLEQPPDAGNAPSDGGSDSDAGPSDGLTPDGKVVLNRAGTEELRRIPGVGPKRAQAIVDLRTKLGGRFKRLSDLLRVKGIGLKSLKKMEAYVVLDAK